MNFQQQGFAPQPKPSGSSWGTIALVFGSLLFLVGIGLGIAYALGAFASDEDPEQTTNGDENKEEKISEAVQQQTAADEKAKAAKIVNPITVPSIDSEALKNKLKCPEGVAAGEACEKRKTSFITIFEKTVNQIKNADNEARILDKVASGDKEGDEFKVQQERAFATAGWLKRATDWVERESKLHGVEGDSDIKARVALMKTVSEKGFETANKHARRDKNNRVIHATKSIGDIICPPNFNTMYSLGVNGAADCPEKDALCNRCTGFSFPEPTFCTNGSQWNGNERKTHEGPATEPKNGQGGRVQSYSGIYVADGHAPDFGRC